MPVALILAKVESESLGTCIFLKHVLVIDVSWSSEDDSRKKYFDLVSLTDLRSSGV